MPEEQTEWTPFRPLRFGDLMQIQDGEMPGQDDSPDPPEDIESDYQAYRQDQQDRALVQDARERLNIPPPGPQGAMARTAPQREANRETLRAGGEVPSNLPPVEADEPQDATVMPEPPRPGLRRGNEIAYGPAVRAAGRVARDVAQGAIEGPRQAVGGVSDAVRNVALGLDSLANWLNDNVADLRFPSTGYAALDNPLQAIAGDGPQVGPATSTTGGLIRSASRWLTGFIPVIRGLRAAGIGSAVTQGIVGGALADAIVSNPDDPNLMNLFQGVPGLEQLATNPDDPQLLNRARNALVSAGMGALTEGVLRGVRVWGAARRARGAAQGAATGNADEIADTAVQTRLRETIGDPEGPVVTFPRMNPADRLAAAERATAGNMPDAAGMTARAGSEAAAGVPGRAVVGEPEVMINFARINTPDDVRSILGQMVERYAPAIDSARRGVRSNEATASAADALGMTPAQLLARRSGQAFNAEESLAARRLLTASAERLTALARVASGPTASPADQYAFRRMVAAHYAIQSEVIGARAEAARALQSWAIPAGATGEATRAVEALVMQSGGFDVSREMATRLANLVSQGATLGAINATIRRGWAARTRDAVVESHVLGLLWNPATHIANTTGNTIGVLQSLTDRAVAARISHLAGRAPGEGVAPGEAAAQVYGMIGGLRDAFRMAGQALRTGQAAGLPGRTETSRIPAITAAAFDLDEAGTIGRVVDFLGRATRVPGHLLAASDAFFSSIGFRMEVHSQALRMASSEGLEGRALAERVGELIANPPNSIRLRAADAALYNTFQNEPGAIGQALMRLRNARGADDSIAGQLNPMFLVLPYIRTPVNIVSYAFEHSPLAPLVGRWRADIAAGGAARDIALARMGTGTVMTLLALDAAQNGLITGGGPARGAERENLARQGWQPYSVRIGNSYYSYNRLDPFGMSLAFAANVNDALRRGDVQPEDVDEWQEVVAGGIMVAARSVVDRSYLQGASNFFELVNDPRQNSVSWTNNQISSMMPFTSLFGTAERLIDPTTRYAGNPLEAIQSRIPILSERLTPRRDLWGQPIGEEAGPLGSAYDWASPIRARAERASPIDAELQRIGYFPERVKRQTSIAGTDVNLRDWPEVYDAYVRLAGNDLPIDRFGGLGLRDYLNAVVSGEGGNAITQREHRRFQSATGGRGGQRQQMIQTAITTARQAAGQAIVNDPQFADFREYWDSQRTRRAERRPDIRPRFNPLARQP